MSQALLAPEAEPATALAIEAACSRVAPLWPLQHFVAVNPFLGLSQLPFTEANRLMEKVAHSSILMNAEYYLNQIREGGMQAQDIRAALIESGNAVNPPDPALWLMQQLQKVRRSKRILTVADWLDQKRATAWANFVVDEVSKWCSCYFDRGQSYWKAHIDGLSLYGAWKHAAGIDANPEVFGLPGFRSYVRSLPESEEAAIEQALELLNVPAEFSCDFLHRQLMSVFGWSSYAAYEDRQGSEQPLVRQVLAIRLAYDAALFSLDMNWRFQDVETADADGCAEARYIAQLALESAFRSNLIRKLDSVPPPAAAPSRKALQAIFCIDVRSEVFRRALEAQSSSIETAGFAGFFGMPLDFDGSERCPALIVPQYQLHAEPRDSGFHRLASRVKTVWKSLCNSASACFSSVEVGGLWFAISLLKQAGRMFAEGETVPKLTWFIPLEAQVKLAASALKNLSLDTSLLAQVVLLCGHGSRTENNPYGSSLDCGACGGHKGDVNARFAAALMNDSSVRQGLKEFGLAIPEDTVFVAGLHNTTTDDVTLFGEDALPEKDRKDIKLWLECASSQARRERSRVAVPDRETRRRSRDWSEVRPEWGLAGNAAFIAAPRSRTRGLDLEGRVFLHEYDPNSDPDASALELVLTAPVVVASWINLQYYASTVNNKLFGSGNKVLHNVVGQFGIWEGNGGDLRTGLPLQSLHDGKKWMHQPLRLQVFLEAPRDRIDRVLRANPEVRSLVENGWIRLLSVEGGVVYEFRVWGGTGSWESALAGLAEPFFSK